MVAAGSVGVMEVLVGGEVSQEWQHRGKVYVDMQLQHPTSYEVEYVDQTPHGVEVTKWPVTPFQVQCRNLTEQNFWVDLYLDGEWVDQEFAAPKGAALFKGLHGQEKLREFLFALPRNQRVTDGDEVAGTDRLKKLGTVEVVFREATFLRHEYRQGPGRGAREDMRQANKIEARKCAVERMKEDDKDSMTGTSRIGQSIGEARSYEGRVPVWSKGNEVGRAEVHYRQKHVLINLGVISSQPHMDAADAFNQLLVALHEAVDGCDWRRIADRAVALAGSYSLPSLPHPISAYKPEDAVGVCIKVLLGECSLPLCAGDRHAAEAQLSLRLGSERELKHVTEDANTLFSAAAVAMFGCEDLYFMLKMRVADEVKANPERFGQDFVRSIEAPGAQVEPEPALQALADATGVHWLVHTDNDNGIPHVCRPASTVGKSKERPCYTVARLPGKRDAHACVMCAVVPVTTGRIMASREKTAVILEHTSGPSHGRKRRASAIELE